jgi:hypothetical protein
MNINALQDGARTHLVKYVGLDAAAAQKLVTALCDAAQAELLDMVSGGEPYPSSMSELRVLRLRYICEAAGRRLTASEVAVLFRTTEGSAETLLTRMQATYPDAVSKYLDQLVVASAHPEEVGAANDFRYEIRFDELAAWEHAVRKLRLAGCSDLKEAKSTKSMTPPREVGEGNGAQDVLDLLSIKDKLLP